MIHTGWTGPNFEVPHHVEGIFMAVSTAAGGARHRAGVRSSTGGGYKAPARAFAAKFPGFVRLVQDKFRIDELYDLVLDPARSAGVSRGLFAIVDRIIVDKILVEGTGVLVDVFARLARAVQGGDGQRYMAVFAVGVAAAGPLRQPADAAVHQDEGDADRARRRDRRPPRQPRPDPPARVRVRLR